MINYIKYLLKTKKCVVCKDRFDNNVYGQKTCSKWCRKANIYIKHKRWLRKNKKKINSEEYKLKRKEYDKKKYKEYKNGKEK